MNILIACGGTGGHLFPGIAVAEALESQGHSVLLLISEKKVDAQASKKYGLLKFKTVPAIAKPSTFSLKMIPFLLKLRKSIKESRKILLDNQSDVVLAMGGFTSLAPIYAGKKLGLSTYVHDSNALPGKANRLISRWCKKVFLGLEAASSYFPSDKVIVTGTPVRKELTVTSRQDRARVTFNLPFDGKAVMVMGGSQGAQHLNTLIVEAAEKLQQIETTQRETTNKPSVEDRKTKAVSHTQPMSEMAPPQSPPQSSSHHITQPSPEKQTPKILFLHITGENDYQRVKDLTKDIEGYEVLSFCNNMAEAYAACDLAICRAGASSMTELAYIGMPSILVPYPFAADDHQTKNAEVFERAGAALLRQESSLNTESLTKDLTYLFNDEQALPTMATNARKLSVDDAALRICNIITSTSQAS